MFLISAPGAERVRYHFELHAARDLEVEVDPRPIEEVPAGFVAIATPNMRLGTKWMARYEVTSEEYLEFLNDPGVLEQLERAAQAGEWIRFPRSASTAPDFGHWDRGEDGSFSLAEGWSPKWPVIGVSHPDAVAYAEWRTGREGRGRFRLPSQMELQAAGGAGLPRYSWGERFDQRFANTCFSRRMAGPLPVGTHPVDEGPSGVFDLCGNAAEWTSGWFDTSRSVRHAAGGSWGQALLEVNLVAGGNGIPEGGVSGETGIRLVWEPEAPR